MSQEMQEQPIECGKGRETDSLLELLESNAILAKHIDFSPVRLSRVLISRTVKLRICVALSCNVCSNYVKNNKVNIVPSMIR